MIKDFFRFMKDIFVDRRLIFEMAKNDFKLRNAGSLLGVFWVFFQPLLTILVMWLVYEFGFRTKPLEGIPFIIWFIVAYIPWIFFSDILSGASNCLYEYHYLVKKVKFRVSILPIVKILSAFITHIFFLIFILLLFKIYGQEFNLYFLQIIYYSFSLIIFSMGLSWLLSALSAFLKDISQVVNVFLQIGFWITPIFWNPEEMVPSVGKVLKLNPVYYIIRGYRDSFIYRIPFWERRGTTLYFWLITVALFVFGAYVFKKLRPFFADEL